MDWPIKKEENYAMPVVKQQGSPDEARLEQNPYPSHTQLIWRYLGIK